MSSPSNPDILLVEAIRQGQPDAWNDLIAQYEGRLLAFVDSRLSYGGGGKRAISEDIVQETFIGFLTSLPNYNVQRPLESWLFAIAAHKLTDYLRKEGRRPAIRLSTSKGSSSGQWNLPDPIRGASSIARSEERWKLEETALIAALSEQIERWQAKSDWIKLKCMELLFVQGATNKKVAEQLELTEQQVANFKFDFLERLRMRVKKQSLNEDVFPELY